MKAKQKDLDRLAEFAVYKTVDISVALVKKQITTRWELDHRKDRVPQEVVPHTHCRRDQRVLPLGRGRRVLRGPLAEWLEQQAALKNSTFELWRLRKQLCGRRRAGTRWADFMEERFEKQSFDSCDAAPHVSATSRYTWMISMAQDRDWHWTRSKRTSLRKSVSKSGQ